VFPSFREVVVLDAEFHFGQVHGNRPTPVCLCAVELRSGGKHRIWCEPGKSIPRPLPSDAIYVAFSAAAEWGCFLALGWDLPKYVCDLYAEYRCLSNGRVTSKTNSLIDALVYYGCPAMPRSYKRDMRERILMGGPYATDEREDILDYCTADVDATLQLFQAMEQEINLPAALERGRFSKAVAQIEWNGIPVDIRLLHFLQEHWDSFRTELVSQVEAEHQFHVYRRTKTSFSFNYKAFDAFLVREGLDALWRRTSSGRACLEDEYLELMAEVYPRLEPFRALRKTLSLLRVLNPPIGRDGRNRSSIKPFSAKTSRNQPRTRDMIMCFPAWLRSLMRAEPGHALIYVDLSSAEFGIAGALSRDSSMMEDYRQGDPYLSLGKRMGVLPPEATKTSHQAKREVLKSVCLGAQYGMGPQTLALKLKIPLEEADELLRHHRRAYPRYWKYADTVVEAARFERQIWTSLDWRLNDAHLEKTNSLRNFPMQATCADILRLACCLAVESGLEVVAPFHDAVLIHVPTPEIDRSLRLMRDIFARASAALLNGFELRSGIERKKTTFEYPHRYKDGRQFDFFEKALQFLRDQGCAVEEEVREE
jgi:DNA polymerase I